MALFKRAVALPMCLLGKLVCKSICIVFPFSKSRHLAFFKIQRVCELWAFQRSFEIRIFRSSYSEIIWPCLCSNLYVELSTQDPIAIDGRNDTDERGAGVEEGY